ncbi:MAG: CRISPR-associated helicase Cas3' [Bacteroidota bacterium]
MTIQNNTSSSFELLSHPDRTLKEHLDSCYFIGNQVLKQKTISPDLLPKSEIEKLFKQLVYFHDFGKSTDFFQYKITEATRKQNPDFILQHQSYFDFFETYKKKNAARLLEEDDALGRHSLVGAYFQLARNKRENIIEDLILYRVIKKHHGNLTNFYIHDGKDEFLLEGFRSERLHQQLAHLPFELYQKILPSEFIVEQQDWESVKQQFSNPRFGGRVFKRLKKEKTLRYFFLQHYLFSLLLSADKGDVKLDNKEVVQPTQVFSRNIVSEYKRIAFEKSEKKAIDEVREAAYQDIAKNVQRFKDHHFFSITLPTGMGKTFSAYNAAIQLQNLSQGTPRIVYCLPFTSIIDQNVKVLSDIFEKNNVDLTRISKNHHLSNPNTKSDKYELSEQEGEYLTDGWEYDFIVTTFVQLTEGIFSNKNRLLRKFHNLTDSVIILDEVQNIPAKYYEAIEQTFQKMAAYFDTKFLFVTATQPLLMPNTEVVELTDVERVKTRAYFENLNRIQLDKSLLPIKDKVEISDWFSIFEADLDENEDKSFLFILNTVASSQELFEYLSSYQNEDCYVFYLSSSILPCFRKDIIDRIKKDDGKRKIVVSTQVVEAGVDIDLDIVYRDFAPLDSINQSAGRCNRNGLKGKGIVKLFNTGKSKLIYDSILLDITKEILESYDDLIEESKLYDLNITYFEAVKNRIQTDNQVSQQLIECMERLQLEDFNEQFKLIDKTYPVYNVFVPFELDEVTHLDDYQYPTQSSPKEIWKQYLDGMQIEDRFERKQVIKKMRAELMQYVTKIPQSKYEPPDEKEDNAIIYDANWARQYSLERGYLNPPPDVAVFL